MCVASSFCRGVSLRPKRGGAAFFGRRFTLILSFSPRTCQAAAAAAVDIQQSKLQWATAEAAAAALFLTGYLDMLAVHLQEARVQGMIVTLTMLKQCAGDIRWSNCHMHHQVERTSLEWVGITWLALLLQLLLV
jgi:hypothetical protein